MKRRRRGEQIDPRASSSWHVVTPSGLAGTVERIPPSEDYSYAEWIAFTPDDERAFTTYERRGKTRTVESWDDWQRAAYVLVDLQRESICAERIRSTAKKVELIQQQLGDVIKGVSDAGTPTPLVLVPISLVMSIAQINDPPKDGGE